MSDTSTRFNSAEGILLVRQPGGKTMAVHLTAITVNLTAVVDEPELLNDATWFAKGPTLTHYDVGATGEADRLYFWEGADPFAKPELESTQGGSDRRPIGAP